MSKKYYYFLSYGGLISLVLPIVVYFSNAQASKEDKYIKTEYIFISVSGPIQPIPHELSIDKNWLLLGKALFHSPLLSRDNTISCASCHMIDFGGDDGFSVSTGVDNKQGQRNSPTVLNAVFSFRQFWDGRASNLGEQAKGPIHNPVEMDTNWAEITAKLSVDAYFRNAFDDLDADGITVENIIKAIVTYEESLITPNSPIDRFLLGEKEALSAQQKRGLNYFINYGCATCHQGRNIGGNIYQKLGRINDIPEVLTLDKGRFSVTGDVFDEYVFKVPSLRNIAETAPYFHNGAISTLPEAVRIMASSQLGRELTNSEVEDIVALLHAFTGKKIEVQQ